MSHDYFVRRNKKYLKYLRDRARIKNTLARSLARGFVDVKASNGVVIDIVSDTHIVMVDQYHKWRALAVTLNSVQDVYPSHIRRIHLFGDSTDMSIEFAVDQCKNRGIEVTFDDEGQDDDVWY